MMKKMFSFLMVFVICASFSLAGCITPKPKTYVHGDWEVIYNEDGTCTIYDFSEEGKQKEVLVFPEEVAGREVIGTYYVHSGYYTNGHWMKSKKLKKLFFTKHICLDYLSIEMANMGKIIINYDATDFLTYEHFQQRKTGCYITDAFMGQRNSFFKKVNDIPLRSSYAFYANTVFYYNYNSAQMEEMYWVDDYDEELITYIPNNPVREGYEFVGWYKEPECITKWDFETDIVPKKEYGGSREDYFNYSDYLQKEYVYKETKLFAKWEIVKGE